MFENEEDELTEDSSISEHVKVGGFLIRSEMECDVTSDHIREDREYTVKQWRWREEKGYVKGSQEWHSLKTIGQGHRKMRAEDLMDDEEAAYEDLYDTSFQVDEQEWQEEMKQVRRDMEEEWDETRFRHYMWTRLANDRRYVVGAKGP